MPESGTFGSVRGVPGNEHSYRDNGATARLLGHRQTKGAATDKPDLLTPRHISTLPRPCENAIAGQFGGRSPFAQIVKIDPGAIWSTVVSRDTARAEYYSAVRNIGDRGSVEE